MISGLFIPHDVEEPVRLVRVNERDVRSYYPYVSGGPAEAGHLELGGHAIAAYVNSRYADFEEDTVNLRASALFELAGVGMFLGQIRGDTLLVSPRARGDYERSMPRSMAEALIAALSQPSSRAPREFVQIVPPRRGEQRSCRSASTIRTTADRTPVRLR